MMAHPCNPSTHKFGANLSYRLRPCLKRKTIKQIDVAKAYSYHPKTKAHPDMTECQESCFSFIMAPSHHLQTYYYQSLSILRKVPFWTSFFPRIYPTYLQNKWKKLN